LKDTFNSIPISMFFVSEIEAVTLASVLQRVRSINEKHGVNETLRVSFAHQKSKISGDVGDVVFLGESRQKRLSENLRCRRFTLCME